MTGNRFIAGLEHRMAENPNGMLAQNIPGVQVEEMEKNFDQNKKKFSDTSENVQKNCLVCCICLDDFTPDSEVVEYPECRHLFCAKCIEGWNKTQARTGKAEMSCPTCRQ